MVRLALQGRSFLVTGPGGCGKSHVLARVLAALRRVHGASRGAVAVVAPTGVAAANIGAVTLHSWSGIGLGRESKEALLARARGSYHARVRWEAARVLVIDEVGMLDAALFDKLEWIARHIRRDNRPFGGLQLVAAGDFLQLAPIGGGGAAGDGSGSDGGGGDGGGGGRGGGGSFCFDAARWSKVVLSTVLLRTIFRQEDAPLQAALSEVRRAQHCNPKLRAPSPACNRISTRPAALCARSATLRVQVRRAQDGLNLSRATQRVLRACTPAAAAAGDAASGAGCDAGGAAGDAAEGDWCRLFATNAECDALNSRRLCALPGASRAYEAR